MFIRSRATVYFGETKIPASLPVGQIEVIISRLFII